MSDLNDDLLNYEIGDVDDNDLIGADEDELLLSDDESLPVKISQEQEKDLLGEEKLLEVNPEEPQEQTPAAANNEHQSVIEVQNSQLIIESTEERTEHKTPTKQINTRASAKRSPASGSTNLPKPAPKIEKTKSGPTKKLSETPKSVHVETENVTDSVQVSGVEAQPHIESYAECPATTALDNVDPPSEYSEPTKIIQIQDTQFSSQLTSDETSFDNELNYEELDADDSDEDSERRNPKTCVERSVEPQQSTSNPSEPGRHQQQQQQQQQQGPNMNRHQRGGGHFLRGRFPPPFHPYRTPGNENFNPQFHPQYRPPQNHMMGGRPMHPPQFGNNPIHHYRGMPMRPGMLPPPHGPQPHPGAGPPFFNCPSGPMPPRGASAPFGQRFPPRPNFSPQNRHPMHGAPLLPPQQQPIHRERSPAQQFEQQPIHNPAGGVPIPQPQLPTLSRKVLINPNFKGGGVQGAKNQLMKDTMGGTQFLTVNSDAELLRQQEAFINQNRMHIEKRRRSRERSPDRDRERSYSPPNRRRPYTDRDGRRPYNNAWRGGGDNRGRRGGSRDNDNFRRRNSGSFDRDMDRDGDRKGNEVEEDEETRAYRLEIEKQKAMREKILKDKETRRRKAAEVIKSKDEDKKPVDEAGHKLKPIIVTEKKIISLKKKSNEQTNHPSETTRTNVGHSPQKRQLASGRKIPTATIHPETKRTQEMVSTATTAVVKPVLKQTAPAATTANDLDEYDEDALLADSPPASPVRVVTVSKMSQSSSSNRRVVVRSSNSGGRRTSRI